MKNRLSPGFAAAFGILATGFLGNAVADEAYPRTGGAESVDLCRHGPEGGGCARFQGYIYVGRAAGGESEIRLAPAGDPSLGEGRLYVHAGGPDNR